MKSKTQFYSILALNLNKLKEKLLLTTIHLLKNIYVLRIKDYFTVFAFTLIIGKLQKITEQQN